MKQNEAPKKSLHFKALTILQVQTVHMSTLQVITLQVIGN